MYFKNYNITIFYIKYNSGFLNMLYDALFCFCEYGENK